MTITFCLLLSIVLSVANGAPTCESTWTPFQGQLCIKAFTNLETYEDAKAFCASQSDDDISPASLVMGQDAQIQELLENYTDGIFDYIWLGGRYDVDSSQFKWDNGDLLTYTNWMDGYPRNDTGEDDCIELRPAELLNSQNNIMGKWAHASCRKRNLVMCQKSLSWSLQDAVAEIISLRRQHEEVVAHLQTKLQELTDEVTHMSSRVVLVGSIYVEYYGQQSPEVLWPILMWRDITSTYAGLFFRAEGNGSPVWGDTQQACAPRIKAMQYEEFTMNVNPKLINLTINGWSEYERAGDNLNPEGEHVRYYEGMRFNSEDCEVRPKNQAIRIWRRMA